MDLLSPLLLVLMIGSVFTDDDAGGRDAKRAGRRRTGVMSSKRRRPTKGRESEKDSDEFTTTNIVDKLLHYYNKQEHPMKDRPTEVRLGIYVNSFYSISEQTMDYSLNFYFRQAWQDPRLKFEPIGELKKIKMEDAKVNHLWLPDTFFRNEKGASFHTVTVPNRLLRLNASGHVWYVTKISATLSCPMKLQKYPLDTQMCPMMFESFGYTMDVMYFSWLDSPVDVDKGVQLPQFTLQDVILYDCSQNYTAGLYARPMQAHSSLYKN